MPDLGGSGIDPTFTVPELLADTWGTTPEKVCATFDGFSSPPDGDAALRRLQAVLPAQRGPYVVLDLASGVHIVPYTSAHTSWAQTAFLTLSEAYREAQRLAGWV